MLPGKRIGGSEREFGIDMYTLLYFKWITNKVLLYFVHCYVAAWMGRQFREEWIHVYVCMAESFCFPPETITMLLISYTRL